MPKYVYEIAVTASTNFFDTDNVDWKFGKFHKVSDEREEEKKATKTRKNWNSTLFRNQDYTLYKFTRRRVKDKTRHHILLRPFTAASIHLGRLLRSVLINTSHKISDKFKMQKCQSKSCVYFFILFIFSLFLYLIIIVQRHTKKTMKIHNEDS